MANWKALCAELLAELHAYKIGHPSHDTDLVDRARAALTEPQGDVPTDEELMEVLPLYSYEDGLYDGFFQPGSLPSNWGDEDDYIAPPKAILVFARAVLARWGRPAALRPIPVAERLPGPEDCDAEGRCWWVRIDTWMLKSFAVIDGDPVPLGSHWLPAHALPLPSGEVEK